MTNSDTNNLYYTLNRQRNIRFTQMLHAKKPKSLHFTPQVSLHQTWGNGDYPQISAVPETLRRHEKKQVHYLHAGHPPTPPSGRFSASTYNKQKQ
jgi:hypothetical protein